MLARNGVWTISHSVSACTFCILNVERVCILITAQLFMQLKCWHCVFNTSVWLLIQWTFRHIFFFILIVFFKLSPLVHWEVTGWLLIILLLIVFSFWKCRECSMNFELDLFLAKICFKLFTLFECNYTIFFVNCVIDFISTIADSSLINERKILIFLSLLLQLAYWDIDYAFVTC